MDNKKKIRNKWLFEFSKDIKNLLNKNKKIISKIEDFQLIRKDFVKSNFKRKEFSNKKFNRNRKKFSNRVPVRF